MIITTFINGSDIKQYRGFILITKGKTLDQALHENKPGRLIITYKKGAFLIPLELKAGPRARRVPISKNSMSEYKLNAQNLEKQCHNNYKKCHEAIQKQSLLTNAFDEIYAFFGTK